MARNADESALTLLAAESVERDGLLLQIAGPEDDPALRRLLRANPIPGWITLSYEREPSYFLGATVEGTTHHTLIARETSTGEAVGMCSRSIRNAYINGRVRRLGYLGGLRVAIAYRGRLRRLRQGYDACRELLHADHDVPFYLTSIIEANHSARRMLTAGVSGLPTYQELAPFSTLALACRQTRPRHATRELIIRRGLESDLPEIASLLQRTYVRYQCAPSWTEAGLRSTERCRGLSAKDFMLAYAGHGLVGCLALWDQRGFKQTVVRGYAPSLARWRRPLNLAAPLLGWPSLPEVGTSLPLASLTHLAVDDDDPAVLIRLLRDALLEARRRGFAFLMLGLGAENPLLRVVKRTFHCLEYRSMLYLVYWEDGREAAHSLDSRPVHVEVATL